MISITRVSAVIVVLLATACTASTAADAPAGNPADDTSLDELNTTARFTKLTKGPTDRDLAAFSTAAAKFDGSYRGVYRFNKAGPEATDPAAREKRIKEVMHRYMCSFFDDSISLGRNSGASAVKKTLADVNLDSNASAQSAADVAQLTSALTKVYANKKLDVLSGSASGNNTAGEVMGVYDIARNEILFFGYTNCGSDN